MPASIAPFLPCRAERVAEAPRFNTGVIGRHLFRMLRRRWSRLITPAPTTLLVAAYGQLATLHFALRRDGIVEDASRRHSKFPGFGAASGRPSP